jgi:hypothetical protein
MVPVKSPETSDCAISDGAIIAATISVANISIRTLLTLHPPCIQTIPAEFVGGAIVDREKADQRPYLDKSCFIEDSLG